MANVGMVGLDWQERVNWDRLRKYRLERARERMKAHGLGAMLLMYDENVRYVTSTLTPGWNRLKPGLRYALLCGDDAPVLFEQGDIGMHIEKHSPWIPKENIRYSYAWIKGAAGPASTQQVTKFTNAIKQEMKKRGVDGMKLGVDFIDINMIQIFKDAKIDWVDGMTPMMEARAVKNQDEHECMRQVGAIGDAAHWEFMKFLKPGLTENQLTAHIMEFLYNIPGHGGRGGRDRVLGSQHLAQLAQFLRPHHQAGRHGLHGSGRAHVERLQVVLLPHLHGGPGAEPGAEGLLRAGAQVAVRLDQGGEGRRHHARHRARSGRRPRKPGATKKKIRPPPTCGATVWVWRSTTSRSSRASGRSITRSRSRKAWCSRSKPSTASRISGACASRKC